jgi:hypothetical protein
MGLSRRVFMYRFAYFGEKTATRINLKYKGNLTEFDRSIYTHFDHTGFGSIMLRFVSQCFA